MRKFTVIGYYPDNDQPWVGFTKARTAFEAPWNAVNSMENNPDRNEIVVVAVIEGYKRAVDNFTETQVVVPDEICDTNGCNNSLNDGEGYDGYCGACADIKENQGE